MCFEFMYACDETFMHRFLTAFEKQPYFMISIGYLNYFYTDERSVYGKIAELLSAKKIVPQVIGMEELLTMISFEETKELQRFYGNEALLNKMEQEYQDVPK